MPISSTFAQDDYQALRKLTSVIEEFAETEKATLQKSIEETRANYTDTDEREQYLDSVEDQLCVIERMEELCEGLILIALYKKVELTSKRILAKHFGIKEKSNDEAANAELCWQSNRFKGVLHQSKILPVKVECMKEVNEIRIICNAIKHQGAVTAVLERKYKKSWKGKKGQKFSNLVETYRRLQPSAEAFLKDLDKKLQAMCSKLPG